MKTKDALGQFEELVLTSVAALRDKAYGMAIHEKAIALSRRPLRLAAVYITLERMIVKKYLTSWLAKPTPERGGRAKRYYLLTASGTKVLTEATTTGMLLYETFQESLKAKPTKKKK